MTISSTSQRETEAGQDSQEAASKNLSSVTRLPLRIELSGRLQFFAQRLKHLCGNVPVVGIFQIAQEIAPVQVEAKAFGKINEKFWKDSINELKQILSCISQTNGELEPPTKSRVEEMMQGMAYELLKHYRAADENASEKVEFPVPQCDIVEQRKMRALAEQQFGISMPNARFSLVFESIFERVQNIIYESTVNLDPAKKKGAIIKFRQAMVRFDPSRGKFITFLKATAEKIARGT